MKEVQSFTTIALTPKETKYLVKLFVNNNIRLEYINGGCLEIKQAGS